MNREQSLDALAQRRVIRTRLIEISGTLAGVQLQGRAKNSDFAIGWTHGLVLTLQHNAGNEIAN
jgi:hypothetical protein